MSDAAEPEIVSLQIVDKDGKIVRTVDDVKATRVAQGDKVGFVVVTKTLKAEKLEAGQLIVDAEKGVYVVKSAKKAGQGEKWSVQVEKKP